MILGSKHVGAILSVLMYKVLCMCISWCADQIKVRQSHSPENVNKPSETQESYNEHDWWKFCPFCRANFLGSASFVKALVSGNSNIITACSELTWTNTIIDWTCRKRVSITRTNRCRQWCWLPAGGSIVKRGSEQISNYCLLNRSFLLKSVDFKAPMRRLFPC